MSNEKGQGLTEYAMIIAFIAIIIVTVLTAFGQTLITNYYDLINSMIP